MDVGSGYPPLATQTAPGEDTAPQKRRISPRKGCKTPAPAPRRLPLWLPAGPRVPAPPSLQHLARTGIRSEAALSSSQAEGCSNLRGPTSRGRGHEREREAHYYFMIPGRSLREGSEQHETLREHETSRRLLGCSLPQPGGSCGRTGLGLRHPEPQIPRDLPLST